MKTSETVTDLAMYISECCGEELIFDVGDTFQRCPKCQGLCAWELEDEIVRTEKLDREIDVAA